MASEAVLFAAFWVVLIVAFAGWRIWSYMKGIRAHRPLVVRISGGGMGATTSIERLGGPQSQPATPPFASEAELRELRDRWVKLIEQAEKQPGLTEEIRQKIISEYKQRIAEVDEKLRQ
jgi:hypothetical protein